MDFERGLKVDCATRWGMDDEEQMEVERRVRDEEPVLLIGFPMCRAFSTLIELTRATGKLSEVKYKNLVERCARHLRVCFRMYETQRSAGQILLHEHPWNAWSRGLRFVREMAEKDGVHKTNGDLCRFQLTTNSVEKGSWFTSNSGCIIGELSLRCYTRDGQAENYTKRDTCVDGTVRVRDVLTLESADVESW